MFSLLDVKYEPTPASFPAADGEVRCFSVGNYNFVSLSAPDVTLLQSDFGERAREAGKTGGIVDVFMTDSTYDIDIYQMSFVRVWDYDFAEALDRVIEKLNDTSRVQYTEDDIHYFPVNRNPEWPDSVDVRHVKIGDRYFNVEAANMHDAGGIYAVMAAAGMIPSDTTAVFEADENHKGLGVTPNDPAGNPPVVHLPGVRDADRAIKHLLDYLNWS